MLIVRGLVTFIGGLAFIFLPGAVVSAVIRRDLRLGSSLMLWGLGLILLIFPALFISTVIQGLITGGHAPQGSLSYVGALLTGILTALFIEGGKYYLLRFRKVPPEELPDSGMMVGLGVGLMFQVILGIALVGTGLILLFGDTSTPELAKFAAQTWQDLLATLAAYIVYRMGLVALSTATGLVVARSLVAGQRKWLWLAVAISAVAAFIHDAIGLALGDSNLTVNLVMIAYEGILAVGALRWLAGQKTDPPPERKKKPGRRVAAPETQ